MLDDTSCLELQRCICQHGTSQCSKITGSWVDLMVFSDGFPNLGSIMGYTYKRMGGGGEEGWWFIHDLAKL